MEIAFYHHLERKGKFCSGWQFNSSRLLFGVFLWYYRHEWWHWYPTK